MLTYYLEDFCFYIDKIKETSMYEFGKKVSFINNSYGYDLGILEVDVKDDLNSLEIKCNGRSMIINGLIKKGSYIVLNFRNMNFTVDGKMIFVNEIPSFVEQEINVISIDASSNSNLKFKYTFNKPDKSNNEVAFINSMDFDENKSFVKSTNIFDKEKQKGIAKTEYSFSISGLWNNDEADKYSDLFNIRIIDIEGNLVKTLINCSLDSNKNSSSTGNDTAYSLSGKCKLII